MRATSVFLSEELQAAAEAGAAEVGPELGFELKQRLEALDPAAPRTRGKTIKLTDEKFDHGRNQDRGSTRPNLTNDPPPPLTTTRPILPSEQLERSSSYERDLRHQLQEWSYSHCTLQNASDAEKGKVSFDFVATQKELDGKSSRRRTYKQSYIRHKTSCLPFR